MTSPEIWPGKPVPQGASFDGKGVNFAVYSKHSTRIEICIFDSGDPKRVLMQFDLPQVTDHVRHGYVPGLKAGALYGLRVHGPYDPENGHRFNPAKLLVDPYARALHGEVNWKAPVFAYTLGHEDQDLVLNREDSAWGVPKGVVVDNRFDWGNDQAPEVPWRETIIYETHVRGFTQRLEGVPPELRGTYLGLAHPAAIEHFKILGISSVELLPIHEFVDDPFLLEKKLKNYWGYSTLNFFSPAARYAKGRDPAAAVHEFKTMVKALHSAGIEVILDVVYNHTCEGNHLGPTLSLKGVDNATYYWPMPDSRYYLDFTGCGNSLRVPSPQTARLIVDSLRYWVDVMHVDGFRFDLASVLGRVGEGGFDPEAPFFQIIGQDPVLSRVKLIAEPWDVGLGGYQVGNFPAPWHEWNGKYRDAIRRYWKGDENQAGEVGYRMTGSSDLYQISGRRPHASVNFITAHDGFTLHDLVTYGHKHNEANGEENRDGSDDNQSWNCGVEGETKAPEVSTLRARQQRNLLSTLLLSPGVPMICAGDEIGRTQGGNNNAYCQDNEISWLDWKLDGDRKALFEFTTRLVRLRKQNPVLQRRAFFKGDHIWDSRFKDIAWYRPDATEMVQEDWDKPFVRSLGLVLGGDAIPSPDERGQRIVGHTLLILMNAHHEALSFKLPESGWRPEWTLELYTADPAAGGESRHAGQSFEMVGRSLAVFSQAPV
ncbi:MAG: glycogen debranching protein GlgX [Myxococcaceae bacterium]